MSYVVVFFNYGANRDEACVYKTKAAAEKAITTEWFSVYECRIIPVVN